MSINIKELFSYNWCCPTKVEFKLYYKFSSQKVFVKNISPKKQNFLKIISDFCYTYTKLLV